MKIYNKFVESKKEPSNKSDIWFDGSSWKMYKEGMWRAFTLPLDAAVEINKILQEDKSVLQQELKNYLKIQDSPFEKGDVENSAVLKGGNNKVTNANEVALGKYNESNNDTLFSIGIGKSEERKNAFEVKQNGDIYVEGVEGRIQDKLNATDTLDTQIDGLFERIDNLPKGDEFDKEGVYPNLIAGDLAGRGESVPAEFGFRASGGKSIKDGRAYIKRIKGNSVVWNQRLQWRGNDNVYKGLTVTYEGGKVHIQGAPEDTEIPFYSLFFDEAGNSQRFTKNHYYLIRGASEHFELAVYSNVSVTGSNCITQKIGDVMRLYLRGHDLTIGQEVNESFSAQVIDLTQLFQAGNEPTTIEEYEARKPIVEDEYAYNEGEVIHCNTESIKSVCDNAWDEEVEIGSISSNTGENIPNDNALRPKNYIKILPNEQYHINVPFSEHIIFYDEHKQFLSTLWQGSVKTFTTPSNAAYMRFRFNSTYGTTYNHDIMVTLVHSGWKQDTDAGYQPYWQDTLPLPIISKYFPDGMKKAGSAHDEIRFNKATQKWEYSKGRIKSVDMGTFNWNYTSGNISKFSCMMPSDARVFQDNVLPNIMTSLYTAQKNDANILGDKNIYRSGSYLGVLDSSYTDAATFKAAMQGVILYYEAAEWEWVELDAEDQNFRDYYNVADFGTEQMLAELPSAPFSADIIYQFNAVDMIREHEIEINELQAVIATMQAQLASLTSNF